MYYCTLTQDFKRYVRVNYSAYLFSIKLNAHLHIFTLVSFACYVKYLHDYFIISCFFYKEILK